MHIKTFFRLSVECLLRSVKQLILACQKKLLLIDITSTANLAPVNELKVGRKIAEKRSLGFLGAKASATDRVSAGHWAKTLPILEWRARFPLNSVNCVDGN